MTDEQTAEIGHNAPPNELPTVDEIIARLEEENKGPLEHVAKLVERGKDFLVITTDEQEADATEFLVKARARIADSEGTRIKEKSVWDERAGAVHAWFKTKILDVVGKNVANKDESFDPVTRDDLGIGPRVNMALTIFKRDKVEKERKRREEEARLAREAEAKAAREREESARAAREAEEKARREREAEERRRRDEEDRVRREAEAKAAKARQEADEAAAAAARKRNADSKEAAERAAVEARAKEEAASKAREAEEARIREEREKRDREEADRLAAETRAREEREAADRREENRIAEARAAAEAAAAASSAELSRARGGKGGITSLRRTMSVRDVSREELDYMAIGPYFTDEHVKSALKKYADANKATVDAGIKSGKQPVAGAVFYWHEANAGRA